MQKKIIPTGTRFGRLTVIRYDGSHKKPCGTTQGKHLCQCDCGNQVSVLTQNLENGNTKSCGCLSAESKKIKIKPDNYAVINQILLGYKRHAKDRQLEWDLSFEDFKEIIQQPCLYCGKINSNIKYTKNFKQGFPYNGIDRINNNKGYIKNNVVPCCCICNRAKSNMTINDFIFWIIKAAEYLKEKTEKCIIDILNNGGTERHEDNRVLY